MSRMKGGHILQLRKDIGFIGNRTLHVSAEPIFWTGISPIYALDASHPSPI